jgi:16S rRNA processing protein RimM
VRPHKKHLLIKLKGLNSIHDAETYRRAEILVHRSAFHREDENEYFWYELIGLSVYLNTGQFLGTIKSILPTGSHDIYVVEEARKEILIPAIHEVVETVDLKN